MKDHDMLKIMADIGPEAKDTLDSWMYLQWAEFWADKLLFVLFVAMCVWAAPRLFKWMNSQ